MMNVSSLALVLALVDAGTSVPAVIRLKDGTIYRLQAPPHLTAGRFVFTTSDGRLLSLSETEVDEIRLTPPAAPKGASPDPHDSHALGAIARQQRNQQGKQTLLSPAPTPKPKKKTAR
jgi:hypothetical protein